MFENIKRILRKRPAVSLGLNIDEKKVDIVWIEKTVSGIKLVNFISSPLPEGTVDEGLIVDMAVVSKTIKNMMATLGIKSCCITTSVWGKGTALFFKKFSLKQNEELKEKLRQEAGNYLAFAGTDVINDCVILEEIKDSGQRKQRVLHAVATEEVIDSYVEAIKQAGCEIDSIGIGIVEDLRGVCQNYCDEVVILVVMEHDSVNIFLINKGLIAFLYTAGLENDAEKGKFTSRLSVEIEKVITYAREFEGLTSIGKIILVGNAGSVKDANVEKGLSEEFGISVETGDTLSGIDVPANIKKEELSALTRGVGVAIRAAGIKAFPSDINLLPPREIEEKELKTEIKYFFVGILIILAVITLGFASMQVAIGHIKNQTVLAEEILNKPTPVIKALISIERGFEEDSRELKRTDVIIEDVQRQRFSEILNEIKIIIPKAIRLSKIELDKNGGIEFKGEAISQEVVFDFVKNLVDSPYFKDVELKTARDINRPSGVFTGYNIRGKLYFYTEAE